MAKLLDLSVYGPGHISNILQVDASVYAKAFITDGGNDTQVVRGDGTLASISSLSVGNADKLDGYHADNIGTTHISAKLLGTRSGNTYTYYKIGSLPTVSETSSGESFVIFYINNAIDFGNNNPSVFVVNASSRNSYNVVATKITGADHIKVGYILSNNRMEIWVCSTEYYLGKTNFEIKNSANFILDFKKQTNKPGEFIDGIKNIVAYLTSNVASASKLETGRTLTVGNTGKSFNGTSNITWSLSEIGAANSIHYHDDRYSLLGHNHDDRYSLLGHNHDDRYSLLGHNHDDRYSLLGHNHDKVYPKIYTFYIHDKSLKLGTFTSVQNGDFLTIRLYTGVGYNAVGDGFRVINLYIRASNGNPTNGRYFEAYTESHYAGSLTFHIVENDKYNCEIWISPWLYSGNSFYEIISYTGITWTNICSTGTIPTANTYQIPNKALVYTDYINTTRFPGIDKVGTVTSITVKGSNGISGSDTITTSGTITLSNSGVRATTVNGNYLRVNTNGTNADLTIPYAINADTVDGQNFSYSNDSNSPTYLWATNSNGSSFLAARGSISVNYANSAGNANTVDNKHASEFILSTDFSSKELTSNLTTITKTLTVTEEWIDTGIKYTDLTTGTYVVQVYSNTNDNLIWYGYWSGIMTWYGESTNASESDEILLHRGAHAYNGNTIYLRTINSRYDDGRNMRLQIAANKNFVSATYVFKFKKLI